MCCRADVHIDELEVVAPSPKNPKSDFVMTVDPSPKTASSQPPKDEKSTSTTSSTNIPEAVEISAKDYVVQAGVLPTKDIVKDITIKQLRASLTSFGLNTNACLDRASLMGLYNIAILQQENKIQKK